MKKIYSLGLALIMLICSILMPFSAYASDIDDMLSKPIVGGFDAFEWSGDYEIKASKTYTLNNVKYYAEGKELYNQLREKLDSREKSFTVHYFSKSQIHPNTVFGAANYRYEMIERTQKIILGATDNRLSRSCTDGDYSRWDFGSYNITDFTIDNNESGKYCYSFKLGITYRYNDSQSAQLDNKINSIIKNIRKKHMSDYDTVLYVHDLICNSTTYDYEAVNKPDKRPTSFTAYGALISGKSVCQGYSLAFYRICKELGYDVRFVSSDPNIGCHAWNMIRLDGKCYFVDCTWDDACMDGAREEEPHTFFLVDYKDLRAYDKSSRAHELDVDFYSDDYFRDTYTASTAAVSYNKNDYPLISLWKCSLSNYNFKYTGSPIKPDVRVTDENGIELIKNVDYTVSYSSNTKCGLAKATIKGLGDYTSLSTTRTFIIEPKSTSAIKYTPATNYITLSWDNKQGANAYIIEQYDNGKWKKIATTSKSEYKVKKLQELKTYKFRIRAAENINRKLYYAVYSKPRVTSTSPKKVKLSTLTKSGDSFTVSWKQVKCTGYQLQYSTNASFNNAKTVKITKSATLKKTVKKLKKGKKYYVRVRAYRNYKDTGDKTSRAYGVWSAKKAIKL